MTEAGILLGVAVLAGATAAIASAGIGSMLTPLLALRLDFKLAMAIVAIPHLPGGAARLIPLRREIDWRRLRRFGAACAVAALLGALLHDRVANVWLTRSFAALLVLAGLLGLGGAEERIRPGTGVSSPAPASVYFLSHTVEVPKEDEDAGLVTITRDNAGLPFDWNRVSSSRCNPARWSASPLF